MRWFLPDLPSNRKVRFCGVLLPCALIGKGDDKHRPYEKSHSVRANLVFALLGKMLLH
jgi:hypothetical protein